MSGAGVLVSAGTPIRLVLVGNPRLDRSWKNCLAHAAQQLGWRVTVLQDDTVTVGQVADACDGADLLVWARSHKHQPAGDVGWMWQAVEQGGTATASVHLDLYWGIPHREPEIGRHPWWNAQHVFTADGDPGHAALFAARGVNHHWLSPPAADRYARPGRLRAEYAADVVFVGTCGRSHALTDRARLLAWARHRYGDRFRWWGHSRPTRVWGRDLADVYASAHVVLGDSVPVPYYWSDRVPNTVGMGGVLVHPDVPGLAGQYGHTVTVWPRGDLGTLGDVIDGLLADPGRRHRIRADGAALVTDRHLWRHRLTDIAAVCGLT